MTPKVMSFKIHLTCNFRFVKSQNKKSEYRCFLITWQIQTFFLKHGEKYQTADANGDSRRVNMSIAVSIEDGSKEEKYYL